jgi:hypothetical protein
MEIMEEKYVEKWKDLENTEGKLNSEKIWKICWEKSKLKCEMIWKIWIKPMLNSEKI